jgi:hypothetical protein
MKLCDDHLNEAIKNLHAQYYSIDFDDPKSFLRLHRCLEVLFNHAGIEETTIENMPNEVSPERFKAMNGIQDE